MKATSALAAILTMIAVASKGATIGHWIDVNSEAPFGSYEDHAAVGLPDGSIVFMGKYDTTAWRSTDGGASWTKIDISAGWSARVHYAVVALPYGSIVLMGGSGGYNRPELDDVWRSTDQGATWTEMTSNAGWSARYDHAAVAPPDCSIVLMGGGDSYNRFNDVWRSTDQGASWTEMTSDAPWGARFAFAAVALQDNSIVLMGGSNGSHHSDVWRSMDQGASWTEITRSAPWGGRYRHAAVVCADGSIVLVGGRASGVGQTNDAWRSTNQGASWTEVISHGRWSGRIWHAAIALPDGSIVVLGGNEDDVWRTVCQPGFHRGGASSVLCTPCPGATYSSGGLHSEGCTPCPAGTYGQEPGQGVCPVCPLPGRCEAHSVCVEGAADPMCLRCVPGYFQYAFQCVKCMDASLVPLVIGLVALVLILALASCGVFTATAVAFAALFVSTTQLMALYLSFSVQWPAFVAHFAIVLRSMAADVGAPPLACLADLPFSGSFWLILGVYTLTLSASTRRVYRGTRATSTLISARKLRAGRSLMLLVLASFIPLARLSAQALQCTSVQGEDVLLADPDVQCWSGEHVISGVLAIAVLAAQGLLIPVALCRHMGHGFGINGMKSPFSLLRPVADLLQEDRLPRFGVAVLLRHAAVAVLNVLAAGVPALQLALSAALSVAMLVAVWRKRPWKPVPLVLGRLRVDDGLNHLHTWSEGMQLFVLGLGLLVALLPDSERAGFAAVACAVCTACAVLPLVAAAVMEVARRKWGRGGRLKQADPRSMTLQLVKRGNYDQARAMGSDIGDERLQSLVSVEIEMRRAADQLSGDAEGGGSAKAYQEYQRLAGRKLELMQELGIGLAEEAEEEEEEGTDASAEELGGAVRSKAQALADEWEALLAALPPAPSSINTVTTHALDAAASALMEEHSRAHRVLHRRHNTVAFSLGAIEAGQLDSTVAALDDAVGTQCVECAAASSRLDHAIVREWQALRQCSTTSLSDLERAVARFCVTVRHMRDGLAVLERVCDHLRIEGDPHAAEHVESVRRAIRWLQYYLPMLEPPAEDVGAVASRRVQSIASELRSQAAQLSQAVERAKAAGDWEEGLRLLGEVERLREETRQPVATACNEAIQGMKPDLAVALMRAAGQRSWDAAPSIPRGSAGAEVKQLRSQWDEVCDKTRQLKEQALQMTQSRDVADLQRAQDLFDRVQDACSRFVETNSGVPRRLAQRGAFEAAKEAQGVLNTAGAAAGSGASGGGGGGSGSAEPQSAAVV